MTRAFLDTNVIVYNQVLSDPRRAIARSILQQGGAISAQVLNDFAAVARRTLKLSWPDIVQALRNINTLCPQCIPLTPALTAEAVDLANRHQFAIYDALIVAAALKAGCTTLLTEDLSHGLVIDGRLTIQNPFA